MSPLPHIARMARPGQQVSHAGGHDLPIKAIMAGLALLTALFTADLGVEAFNVFVRDAGKSADPTPVSVSVGPVALEVPRNMIRFSAQRGGLHDQLDLYVHWPSLSGFTPERSALFQAAAGGASVIYLTLRPAGEAMAPEDRFRQVYPRVLADDMRLEQDGIVVRSFRPGFGYDGEELHIARDPMRPLVARCHGEPMDGGCLSEFRTGTGLDVSYRFDHAMLADWRDFDTAIRELVAGFAAQGSPG